MSSPGENLPTRLEKSPQTLPEAQTGRYFQFDYSTHKENKEHQADNVEYLAALDKVTTSERQQLLKQAAEWEKKGDLDLLRAGGLSLDEIKRNPLGRHIRLSSMFMRRESDTGHVSFRLDYSGNEMAKWDLDLADILPPNVLTIDLYSRDGKPLIIGATRGFDQGRPGYFHPATKERVLVQEGQKIKWKETQTSLAIREKRLGVQSYENALKAEVYSADNARKTVLKQKVREEASKQGQEVKTDKAFFDIFLTELNKLIDPKVWENFQKNFQIDFSGIEKSLAALIGTLGFAKSSMPEKAPATPGSFLPTALRESTESRNAPRIDRKWLLENVGRSNEQVQRFMININFMGANIRVNKLIAPYLIEAEERCKAAGVDFQCKQSQCSCRNWRPIRGGTELSMHSWGTAVDLNSLENPWQPELRGHNHGGKMKANMPPEFVAIMKDVGFRWGGEWRGPADPMHFEMAANPYLNRGVLRSSRASAMASLYLG